MDQIVSSGSVPVSSFESALQQKQAAGSSVRAKIAAIEGNLSGAANTSNMLKLDFERRFTATQNLKPSSLTVQSLKPAETQINTDTSGSSTPSHQKIMKYVSLTPTDAEQIYYNRLESSKMLKPETRQRHEPSFPKVYHGTKLSVGKQNNSTKGQSFTGRNGWVENITSTKPLKPAKMQKPNYIRATAGAKNKLQRESKDPCISLNRLPDILGNPPSKPKRPPSVDIEKFGRNLKDRNYGRGMKTPPSDAAPPQRPRPCPSYDRAAVLSQQLDEDQSYDNVGMRNPPPLPIQVHPSKRTEADLSEDIYEEPDDKWMEQAGKSKTHTKKEKVKKRMQTKAKSHRRNRQSRKEPSACRKCKAKA
ncbi:uncharacterized protein LOC121943909 [Plectropomus leopardus]|uniref:uncharacterized protein LOC121943909 n=1 Tax=Plectropomus leopardus TaxID=160734 RepID=UPI001C4DD1E6|nr:uncharacterized protein LOC121943909 [Plectropomus leopardus]